jgi:Uma2 family endonuclease
MPVTQQTYQLIALEDPEGQWELHRGRLREKPGITFRHNRISMHLAHQLLNQIDLGVYDVRVNSSRVRFADETYYIPDVLVLPIAASEIFRDRPDILEVYDAPMPLVVEVWSPSTGGYDIEEKLPGYQRRGDLEIWRIHPYERTLTAWRRMADGSYAEESYAQGPIEPIALPGVTIDLDRLFD